jgi:two-component system, CitB family, response regulator DctR
MVLEVNKGFLAKLPSYELVASSTTGQDGLRKIVEHEPHLVLLDMYLPDISGMKVLTEIRNRQLPTDVIMITAARDAKTVQQVFRLGAIDYLVKPFRFERFQGALNHYEKMWRRLEQSASISQQDIDEWKENGVLRGTEQHEALPKGLSPVTLRQIMMTLLEQGKPVTAEQLASHMGMARVTVRRYLEHLVQQQKVNVQMEYGQVGRPSHYYSI